MFSHDVAPMTYDEARMLQEELALAELIEGALYRREYDDAIDLMDRKIALGRRFDASRETTSRAWMERTYRLAPARPSDRRGYWKPRGAA